MALCTGPLFGIIFDNYGPWIPALVCIAGQSAFIVMLGLFNGIPQRAVILVLGHGIASGAMLSVGVAIPGKLFDKKQGLAQGVVMAGSSAGGIVFSRIYKPVFDNYGWSMGNVIIASVVGGIGVVALVCLIPYNSVLPTEARPESGKLRQLNLELRGLLRVGRLFKTDAWKKRSSFAWLIGGQFCHEIGLFGVSASVPLIAESMEATKGMGENVLLALCVASFCTRPCAGFIADRYGYFESLVCSMTLSGILLFSLGTWVHLSTPAHLFAVAVTWSLISSPWIPYYTGAIGEITDAREYGRFVGMYKSLREDRTLEADYRRHLEHGHVPGMLLCRTPLGDHPELSRSRSSLCRRWIDGSPRYGHGNHVMEGSRSDTRACKGILPLCSAAF